MFIYINLFQDLASNFNKLIQSKDVYDEHELKQIPAEKSFAISFERLTEEIYDLTIQNKDKNLKLININKKIMSLSSQIGIITVRLIISHKIIYGK